MKPRYLLILPMLALSQGALAADTSDASPYDRNPACMERADSSKDNCVIQDEGTPRHKFPPPGPAAAARNTGGATGSAATTGNAGMTGTANGGPVARRAVSSGK